MNYKSIKSIEILEEDTLGLVPKKIIIKKEDGTTEEITATATEPDKCFDIVINFALAQGCEIEDLKSNGKITKRIVTPTPSPAREARTPATDTPKKKRKGKIFLAILVALGLAVTVANREKLEELLKDIGEGNFDLNREQPKYTVAQVIPTGKEDDNEYTERVNSIIENGQKVGEGIVAIKEGKMDSLEEFIANLDSQKALAYTNMVNISEYLNGKELTGNIYLPIFTTFYEKDTNEHAVVQYFTGLSNSIVHLAYDGKDKKEIKAAVKEFEEKFVKFVLGDGNNALEINGKYYTFNQLSPSAQYTIVQIGMGVLTIQQDFKVEVDGVTYNRMTAIEEVANLEVDVFKELKAKQKIR